MIMVYDDECIEEFDSLEEEEDYDEFGMPRKRSEDDYDDVD